MTKQLMILPFDHRSSFSKTLMGYSGDLSESQKKKITSMKTVVFDGFKDALSKYKDITQFGILVDEEYGSKILRSATKLGVNVAMPVERSGLKEFKFDYGNSFGTHLEEFSPSHVKVLVRYNPGNKEINKNQLTRLEKLSKFCQKTERKLLFELLVPPTEHELADLQNDFKLYDHKIRAIDTVKAIEEISARIHVDIWKLEGFDSQAAWKRVIKAIKGGLNPTDFGIIFLGRGQSKTKVIEWLKIAVKFKEVIGFAVGRTIFFNALVDYKTKKITRAQAVEKISKNYRYFVNLWKKEKGIKSF